MRTAPPISTAWRNAMLAAGIVLALWAALWALSVVADSTRVPEALSSSASEATVMVCKDGAFEHEGESFFGRLFGSGGQFHCTDWHTRDTKPQPSGIVDWPSSPRR